MPARSANIAIQLVQPEEVELLCAFAEQTFRVAWQADNDPVAFEQYCETSFLPGQFRAEMAGAGVEFYFARLDNRLAAYLKLNLDRVHEPWDAAGTALQLERIYVAAEYQNRGLGANLLRFVENRARETGAEWVWLSVWQKSPRSIAFYQQNGYEIFGVETFWVGDDPQPDWLMRKKV